MKLKRWYYWRKNMNKLKNNKKTNEKFKQSYFSYYDDVKHYSKGNKEDW